jgi:hypothetical protein
VEKATPGKEHMAKVKIRKAEASRNGVLLWYYGIESYLDAATTADDYLALAEARRLLRWSGGRDCKGRRQPIDAAYQGQ